MLKFGMFPLAQILELLVRAGEDALGNPVEIEFAVSLPRGEEPAEFRIPPDPAADAGARSSGSCDRRC
jgi:hypothetical protein